MLPPLTVIPAGAGSGKTFTLQKTLGEWVAKGLVQPERIVAVTFTEAAAAELRERIRAKLLEEKRLEESLRLDDAYISTIHGFGHRLLTEFAFDGGVSPRLRLLSDDEENTLIRQALAKTDKVDPIISNLSHYGYSYDFNRDKSPEECFRDELLDFVKLLRAAGWREDDHDYAAHARNWIAEKYGFTEDPKRLTDNLHQAVVRLLKEYPESLADEYGNNATAKKEFQSNFFALKRAEEKTNLEKEWGLWKSLASLRMSKRGCDLPEEYDALAASVIEAANCLSTHPGPRDHASGFVDAMIAAGQELLEHYAEAKRQAGLIDFNDMIAMAVALLKEHPEVIQTLVSRIDCLVVDEFQDTNPLQFALLWLLKDAGIPTIIVGDLKQAIMGFQGADPRLFAAIEEQYVSDCDPLTNNWRSQPALMTLINSIGESLFGEKYTTLKPKGKDSQLSPLEVVHFEKRAKKSQHMIRATYVGERIKELLGDKRQIITDRRTKQERRLKGGDVAILCPTHNMLGEYASILREMGLRVRLDEEGWYESRIVQLMWQALSYIANPSDRHAALYLSVTELGSLSLEQALIQLIEEGAIDEPLLERLDVIANSVSERTVYALVADTISTLELYDAIAEWPDGEQSRANLLRLQAEAGEFMDANREALASGGYHGSGIQTFLAWLQAKLEKKNGNQKPEPRVLDEDAIELVTWHSSKGREWPVVAVCGFDKKVEAKLPSLKLTYSDFDDLSLLLEKAQIEYSPNLPAEESRMKFLEELQAQQETEAKRLLYVALTRPRDKLILEWPAYLATSNAKAPTYWSILSLGGNVAVEQAKLVVEGKSYDCHVKKGDNEFLEDMGEEETEEMLPEVGRRAIEKGGAPISGTPDSISPSLMKATLSGGVSKAPEVMTYAEPLSLESQAGGTTMGTLLHRCYEVMGGQRKSSELLGRLVGEVLSNKDQAVLLEHIDAFESFIEKEFEPTALGREVPLLAVDENGTVVSGTADLLIETDKGVWIIDHKSDQIDDPVTAFHGYENQLIAYKNTLELSGVRVSGYAINWIRRGEVMLVHSK